MTISPCVHPRCDDGTGNPTLTMQTMCERCRAHVAHIIGWLVEDYVRLRSTLPKPISVNRTTSTGKPTFKAGGHPAEWASDMCRRIAITLNDTEDALRDHLGQEPAAHPHSPEAAMIRNAYRHLNLWIDDLCTFPGARASADELGDLHHEIRHATGLTRFAQRLPTPCPTCDVVALVRFTGHIICESCGRIIREEDYGMFTRIAAEAALDALIEQYDAMFQPQLEG